jgi:hypothetical protein
VDHPELYVRKMIVNEFISSRRWTWRFVPPALSVTVTTIRSEEFWAWALG